MAPEPNFAPEASSAPPQGVSTLEDEAKRPSGAPTSGASQTPADIAALNSPVVTLSAAGGEALTALHSDDVSQHVRALGTRDNISADVAINL